MTNYRQISRLLQWVARIWACMSIVFLLFMIFGHIFGPEAQNFNGVQEIIMVVFFPAGVLIGLLLTFKSVKMGSIIALGSMVVFFILRPETITNAWFWLIVAPALLFLADGFFPRGVARQYN